MRAKAVTRVTSSTGPPLTRSHLPPTDVPHRSRPLTIRNPRNSLCSSSGRVYRGKLYTLCPIPGTKNASKGKTILSPSLPIYSLLPPLSLFPTTLWHTLSLTHSLREKHIYTCHAPDYSSSHPIIPITHTQTHAKARAPSRIYIYIYIYTERICVLLSRCTCNTYKRVRWLTYMYRSVLTYNSVHINLLSCMYVYITSHSWTHPPPLHRRWVYVHIHSRFWSNYRILHNIYYNLIYLWMTYNLL